MFTVFRLQMELKNREKRSNFREIKVCNLIIESGMGLW